LLAAGYKTTATEFLCGSKSVQYSSCCARHAIHEKEKRRAGKLERLRAGLVDTVKPASASGSRASRMLRSSFFKMTMACRWAIYDTIIAIFSTMPISFSFLPLRVRMFNKYEQ
jgi:hypothetical protein